MSSAGYLRVHVRTIDRQATSDFSTSPRCSLDTIGVQRADHDALAPRLTQHLRNSVAVPHQRAALGTRLQQEAGAGADTFGARHG